MLKVGIFLVLTLKVALSQDVSIASFSVNEAENTRYFTTSGTSVTFSVGFSNHDSQTNGTVTGLMLYLTNGDYNVAGIKSQAFGVSDVTFPVPVAANVSGEMVENIVATVLVDEENCTDYTHLCVVLTSDDDTDETNNFMCLEFGGSNSDAGMKYCQQGTTTEQIHSQSTTVHTSTSSNQPDEATRNSLGSPENETEGFLEVELTVKDVRISSPEHSIITSGENAEVIFRVTIQSSETSHNISGDNNWNIECFLAVDDLGSNEKGKGPVEISSLASLGGVDLEPGGEVTFEDVRVRLPLGREECGDSSHFCVTVNPSTDAKWFIADSDNTSDNLDCVDIQCTDAGHVLGSNYLFQTAVAMCVIILAVLM